MSVSRRTLLKYGLAGTALLAAGGVGLALRGTHLRAPSRELAVLSPQEYSILAAVADRICPENGNFPAASTIGVAEDLDELLRISDPAVGEELGLVLRLVENALPGLLLDGRFTTFTGSDPALQDRILEGMRTSRILARRTMFKALNGLVGATYYGNPAVWPAVGYGGPPRFGGAP